MPIKSDIFIVNLHVPAMLFELITSIFAGIIAIIIFKKWRERRIKATLYLSIALMSISIASFIGFTGLLSWFMLYISSGFTSTYSPLYYQISLPLAYLFVIPYDIFLILFTIQIFLNKNDKKVIPFLAVGVIIAVLLFMPNNYWGTNPIPMIDPPSIRTIVMALFLLYNVVIYIILAFYAFRESRITKEKLHKIGFNAIGLGQILNILVFMFFLMDSIVLLFNPASPGYTIYIDLAWISALSASFMFYIGFILPNWFRKIIKS
ncbi:MAG: hypothetical protein ACTSWR_10335 [Candidatus Helarchaeota archaeon]